MKILALENSTTKGSIAWLQSAHEPIVSVFQNDRKHSGAFFQTLRNFSDRFSDFDAVVIGLGPGSYAGIRIAIATAIGLQAGRQGARLLGLPSICALLEEPQEYCAVGDARRQSFFLARIVNHEIAGNIALHDEAKMRAELANLPHDLPAFSSEDLSQFGRVTMRYPSAALLAQLVERSAPNISGPPLEPMYLREPHITKPKSQPAVSPS